MSGQYVSQTISASTQKNETGRVEEKETSTPGVQRCVHMRLSLLRMMQYCINLVE